MRSIPDSTVRPPSSTRSILAVYAVILISHGLINHFGIRLVAWLNDLSVGVHIAGVLAIIAALLLFAPKQPLSFFVQTSTESGKPYWWASVLFGLLQAQWTFTGYEASAHISEETVDPRRSVPWGMVMSVVVSQCAGYFLLFALTLSIPSVPAVLNSTDAQGNHIPAVVAIYSRAWEIWREA